MPASQLSKMDRNLCPFPVIWIIDFSRLIFSQILVFLSVWDISSCLEVSSGTVVHCRHNPFFFSDVLFYDMRWADWLQIDWTLWARFCCCRLLSCALLLFSTWLQMSERLRQKRRRQNTHTHTFTGCGLTSNSKLSHFTKRSMPECLLVHFCLSVCLCLTDCLLPGRSVFCSDLSSSPAKQLPLIHKSESAFCCFLCVGRQADKLIK